MAKSMLSTIDNPFNPFDSFRDWYNYDLLKGYDSSGYLARVANLDNSQSPEEQEEIVEKAIKDICMENPNGMYCRVFPDTKVPLGKDLVQKDILE